MGECGWGLAGLSGSGLLKGRSLEAGWGSGISRLDWEKMGDLLLSSLTCLIDIDSSSLSHSFNHRATDHVATYIPQSEGSGMERERSRDRETERESQRGERVTDLLYPRLGSGIPRLLPYPVWQKHLVQPVNKSTNTRRQASRGTIL